MLAQVVLPVEGALFQRPLLAGRVVAALNMGIVRLCNATEDAGHLVSLRVAAPVLHPACTTHRSRDRCSDSSCLCQSCFVLNVSVQKVHWKVLSGAVSDVLVSSWGFDECLLLGRLRPRLVFIELKDPSGAARVVRISRCKGAGRSKCEVFDAARPEEPAQSDRLEPSSVKFWLYGLLSPG